MPRFVLFLLFLVISIRGYAAAEELRLTAEAEPLATVAGCVNVISGDFFQIETDITVPGIEPVHFSRFYDSGHRWSSSYGYGTGSQMALKIGGLYKEGEKYRVYVDEREGFNIPFTGRRPKKADYYLFEISADVRSSGLSNYTIGGISGRTNLQNTRLVCTDFKEKDEKFKGGKWKVTLGDGTVRYYRPIRPLDKVSDYFVLEKEVKPNARVIHYDYHNNYKLKKVRATNLAENVLFSEMSFDYDVGRFVIYGCNHRYAEYSFFDPTCDDHPDADSKNAFLHAVCTSTAAKTNYEHHKRRLSKIRKPDGRFLEIEFSDGKVKQLKAPVGRDALPVSIYSFDYHKNYTSVYDALKRRRDYCFAKNKLLEKIDHFQGKSVHHSERFFWDDHGRRKGWLKAKALCDAEGKAIHLTRYHYDDSGNIKVEERLGNFTGGEPDTFTINDQGEFSSHTGYYQIVRQHSTEGYNLLLSETLPNGQSIQYTYLPGTNLLTSKLILSHGTIIQRTFHFYDQNAILCRTIEDDGCSPNSDHLEGVTVRHITRIQALPLNNANPHLNGQPHNIIESYFDLENKNEVQIKRTQNSYDHHGQLICQEIFDENDQFCYALRKEYDSYGRVIAQSDALGQVTRFTYDSHGNKTGEELEGSGASIRYYYDFANRLTVKEEHYVDSPTRTTRYTYDYVGQMTEMHDPFENSTKWEYDSFGQQTKIIYPRTELCSGHVVHPAARKAYDVMGNVISETNPNEQTTLKKYTVHGKPYHILYPDGSQERMEYTVLGELAKHWDQDGRCRCYKYDVLGQVIEETLLDSQGNLLTQVHYQYKGKRLLTKIDPMGLVTRYEYDGAGRRTAEICEEKENHFEYDHLGRLFKTRTLIGNGTERISIKVFDFLDRVVEERVEDQKGNVYSQFLLVYDIQGNVSKRIETISETASATTETLYYADGKIKKMIDALGNETSFSYDYHHRNKHNQLVLKKTSADSAGNRTIEIQDPLGRVSTIEKRNPQNILLASESFGYDSFGNKKYHLNHCVYGGKVLHDYRIEWEHDKLNRIVAQIEQQVKRFAFVYTPSGRKSQEVKPDGVILYYDYDAFGRLMRLHSSDGTVDDRYSYDLHNNLIETEDSHHNLTTRFFDQYDNLISETFSNGQTVSFHYDLLGRPLNLTLPDGSQVNYHYDAKHLKEITRLDTQGKVLYNTLNTLFDKRGNLLRVELPGRGGEVTYTYDLLGRCTEINAPSHKESLTYDPVGNITARKVEDPVGDYDSVYQYDGLNQLIRESGLLEHTYLMDSLFNRREKDGVKHEVDHLNQLLRSPQEHYRNDACGNRIAHEGKLNMRYDALNRLIEVVSGNMRYVYRYDALNRRISKDVYLGDDLKQHFSYLYAGQNEIGLLDQNGQLVEHRVLGVGKGAEIGAAVGMELNGNVYLPQHDHNGNVISLQNLKGEMKEIYRFSAFGEEKRFDPLGNSLEESINPWRFASKRQDEETGYLNFGRRYYDPQSGKWITPDPIGFEGGINLYAYVFNNPLSHIDLYGLKASPYNENGFYRPLSYIGSFIGSIVRGIGSAIEFVGSCLPIPLINHGVSAIGCLVRGDTAAARSYLSLEQSHNYRFGDHYTSPEASIGFTNGVRTRYAESRDHVQKISDAHGGETVSSTHVASDGLSFQLMEWVLLLFGAETRSCRLEVQKLKRCLAEVGPNGIHTEYAFSLGAMILDRALRYLSDDELSRLHVVTFGGAQAITNQKLASYTNYVNSNDPIPFITNPIRYTRARLGFDNSTFTFLPATRFIDHQFQDSWYQNTMEFYGSKFQQQYKS